jgi:hypothetical protein
MTVALQEDDDGKILTVTLSGKLTKADYEHLGPEVDRLIAKHGKIRIATIMREFHGWTLGALWDDIKFDFKHFSHIERRAEVGSRDGRVLQTVHDGEGPLFRRRAKR